MPKVCPKCGEEAAGKGKFCSSCGEPLKDEALQGGDLGLKSGDEQAHQEEERMSKMFARKEAERAKATGVSDDDDLAPRPQRIVAKGATAAPQKQQTTKRLPSGIAASAILAEVNGVRKDPAAFAERLGKWSSKFSGRVLSVEQGANRETQEGARAVEEAVAELKAARPCGEVSMSVGMSRSARDLCEDQEKTGEVGGTLTLSDGTEASKRFSKYGLWRGQIEESIVYGALDAFDAVAQYLVDDGVSSRTNRRTLLDPQYTVCGVHCCSHPKFGNVVSSIFAVSYAEGASSGGPAGVSSVMVGAEASGGNVGRLAESGDKCCYSADLGQCQLNSAQLKEHGATAVKKGQFVVLKWRDPDGSDFSHRWRLPFPVSGPGVVTMTCSAAGKLTLSVKKEVITDASAREGETVATHTLVVDPSCQKRAPEVVVEGRQASGGSESIVAVAKSGSSSDSALCVKLSQEEQARSTLTFNFDFRERGSDNEGPYTKSVKSSQTLKLPWVVSTHDVSVLDTAPTSLKIKVSSAPPAPYNASDPEEPVRLSLD